MKKTNMNLDLDLSEVDGLEILEKNPKKSVRELAEIIVLNEELAKKREKSKKDWIEEKESKIEQIREEIAGKTVFSDINSNSLFCMDEDKIYRQITYSKLHDYVLQEFAKIPYTRGFENNIITDTFMQVYKAKKIEIDFKTIIDKKKLKIPFAEGTLYIYEKDGKITHEFAQKHEGEDLNIFKLNINFEYIETLKEEDSIFLSWIKKKFPNKNYYYFFMLYLADLLQPFNYSQTALFLWGAGGIGKNVFEEILKQNIEAKIGALDVENLDKRFQNTCLIESLINISNEISKRDVSSKMFNKCISRESIMFEYKGRDTFMARPLAKWLIFANNPLTIDMTSGVRRRILSLEMQEERIHEWHGKSISKHEFEKLMLEDKKGFTYALVIGTKLLLKYNLDVKNAYDDLIGERENEKLEEHNNSPVMDFLQEYLVEDKNSAVLTRNLAEAYNYLVKETDNSIVAGAEILTIKKFMIELRKNKKYANNLCVLDNSRRGLKKGTYLFGYRFDMDEDKGLKIENIEKIDSIEFLRSEINKK